MKKILIVLLLTMLTLPTLAQDNVFSGEFSPVIIDSVTITRSEDDAISLQIEWLTQACGTFIMIDQYAETYIEFGAMGAIDDPMPDGDRNRNHLHRYINLALFVLPDDSTDCDLSATQTTSLDLSSEINLESEREPYTILLINDFAGWLQFTESNTDELSPQFIDVGETELTRWQKVDSVVESLFSLGADPGTYIPWLHGYHPDGCQSPTMLNIVTNPVEEDHYTAEVFRLLPADTMCPASIQEFLVSAGGVLPQRDAILAIGETQYQIVSLTGEVTPVERRYISIDNVEISEANSGYTLMLSGTQPDTCGAEILAQQTEIDSITFVNIYYDFPITTTCTDSASYRESLTINSLPVLINGTIYHQLP